MTNADFISASFILLWLSELKAGSSEQGLWGKPSRSMTEPIRNEDKQLSTAYDLIDGAGETDLRFVYFMQRKIAF